MLTMEAVSKSYPKGNSSRSVLRGVTLGLEKGESLGLVGESGAGKSTLGKCVLGLERPDSGRIVFQGIDLVRLARKDLRPLYRRIQMIFQDPRNCLNPYMRVGDLVREPLENFVRGDRAMHDRCVADMIAQVGLSLDILDRYPHQISGGQCQRAAIARALILGPELLVCDEALSALDAPLQIRILEALRSLQKKMNLTFLFITHDLAMARYFCSRIAVILEGRIVEEGDTVDLFRNPQHPYTRLLMKSSLFLEGRGAEGRGAKTVAFEA